MINVEIYRNLDNNIYGFKLCGHAGFAKQGFDIVCSAVTILVFNTINCIEEFTNEKFSCECDEDNGGFIECFFYDIKKGNYNNEADILLRAMVKGLKNIEIEYYDYVSVYDRRCSEC